MELTAFKNMPDELIRHIMGYARPTYPYLTEIKLANEERTTRFRRYPLTKYVNSEHHRLCFINYKIYGKYIIDYGENRYYEDVVWEFGNIMDKTYYKDEPSARCVVLNTVKKWNVKYYL
jgi:hypothetical protein